MSCRFFNTPEGCRYGRSCKFKHEASASEPGGGRSAPRGLWARGQQRTSSPQNADASPEIVPRGTCQFYWNTGTCRSEFQCRFEHRQRPKGDVPSDAEVQTHLFTSNRGVSPTDTQRQLRLYLRDGFRFGEDTKQALRFLSLLDNPREENTWDRTDGQLFLQALAKPGGNGYLRLNEVIRWDRVVAKRPAYSFNSDLPFQDGYFKIFAYLASDFVVKSAMDDLVNSIYSLIYNNMDHCVDVIASCVGSIMKSRSFRYSPMSNINQVLSGTKLFHVLSVSFYELFMRFKDIGTTKPKLKEFVVTLFEHFTEWSNNLNSKTCDFDDPVAQAMSTDNMDFTLRHISASMDRLMRVAKRSREIPESSATRNYLQNPSSSNEGLIAALEVSAAIHGPGDLRSEGPRHDNDLIYLEDIKIEPTHQELLCAIPPYLPANIPDAPHLFRTDSMERLLDIQFRLLREELIAPLRSAVQLVLGDLNEKERLATMLGRLLKSGGGRYRGSNEGEHSAIFNVYTNVAFGLPSFNNHGSFIPLRLDSPPGQARNTVASARASFWEHGKGGKRLMLGGLVALLWIEAGLEPQIYLATVASTPKDIADSSKQDQNRIGLRLSFVNPDAELRVLMYLRQRKANETDMILLIESPVMFESIRPFLEALRRDPTLFPFERYLAHPSGGSLSKIELSPPRYAMKPGFLFDLSCLMREEHENMNCVLDVRDKESVDTARWQLKSFSRLDASQADAVVDILLRELALLQGPPGTGKSYCGVELMRLLLANHLGPVVLIAFTNHALDHLLEAIFDVTKKVVRLGSRSKNERVAQFSLQEHEHIQEEESRFRKELSKVFRVMKDLEKELDLLMQEASRSEPSIAKITHFLDENYPDFLDSLDAPPNWVKGLYEQYLSDFDGGFTRIVKGRAAHDEQPQTILEFWFHGLDIQSLVDEIEPPHFSAPNGDEEADHSRSDPQFGNRFTILTEETANAEDEDVDDIGTLDATSQWMVWDEGDETSRHQQGLPTEFPAPAPTSDPTLPASPPPRPPIPIVPESNRSLDTLLADPAQNSWACSLSERETLWTFWIRTIKLTGDASFRESYDNLKRKHQEAQERYRGLKDEHELRILRNMDVIGCTTTGAAKLTTLLRSLSPKILLVEEAGQVLEPHILGAMVPSVEHCIMIGDPLQLRPNISNFNLSIDSRKGQRIYRFDVSLMERLSLNGLAMSRLDVQRRMRPQISSLIRNTLYPGLEDHERVKIYPDVRGMAHNVWFFDHRHHDNTNEELMSKRNMFEVEMIRNLVLHLLRQGCYSNNGDIVVLCAYLGQLAALRDALAGDVAIVIGDKEQQELQELADGDDEAAVEESIIEQVQVSRRVLLRTVDSYQGEEGKIILLSLVRNSGDPSELEGKHLGKSIGFLKSPNRTNVAISRAKEGLYILGNAQDLQSRSEMWRQIIEELHEGNAIGNSIYIQCYRHPADIHSISEPDQITMLSPDGGCLRPCDFRLKCGHKCPYKCHGDDEEHLGVRCSQPCNNLCPSGHPCNRECWEKCGDCVFPIPIVELDCGHQQRNVPCYKARDPESINCRSLVQKRLPDCDHEAMIPCSMDPIKHRCIEPCGDNLSCCGRPCGARCDDCRSLNIGEPRRIDHQTHHCTKPLYCGHECGGACSVDHDCTKFCSHRCRQKCVHTQCNRKCSVPCAPCQQPCLWSCDHYSCSSPCGCPCTRLPCDKRCTKKKACGHQCPSLCGEPCEDDDCLLCISSSDQDHVVDLILSRTLSDLMPDEETLDELVIRLEVCGHVFTVETLDGACGIKEFYTFEERKGTIIWRGLAEPSAGFVSHPVCPMCRAPITNPRYGRIFKRADLDLLERNIVSAASRELTSARTILASTPSPNHVDYDFSLLAAEDNCKREVWTKLVKQRKKALDRIEEDPLDPAWLDPIKHGFNHIQSSENRGFRLFISHQRLLEAYKIAFRCATTKYPRVKSWESQRATYYRKILDDLKKDLSKLPTNPEERAMRLTCVQFNGPPPRADKRFIVEAIWITLGIRLRLASSGERWLEALKTRRSKPMKNTHGQLYAGFIQFLFQSCIVDSLTAENIATASCSVRQRLQSKVLKLRSQFERVRFDVQQSARTATSMDALQLQVSDERKVVSSEISATVMQPDVIALRKSAPDWLEEHFVSPANKILLQWDSLVESVRNGAFYDSVTDEDYKEVVRAFQSEFTHTGHFYRCPNGHIYVIADCGGASEASHCPECGAAIGGSAHTLVSGNTRAENMEELLREGGAMQNPYSWGR